MALFQVTTFQPGFSPKFGRLSTDPSSLKDDSRYTAGSILLKRVELLAAASGADYD